MSERAVPRNINIVSKVVLLVDLLLSILGVLNFTTRDSTVSDYRQGIGNIYSNFNRQRIVSDINYNMIQYNYTFSGLQSNYYNKDELNSRLNRLVNTELKNAYYECINNNRFMRLIELEYLLYEKETVNGVSANIMKKMNKTLNAGLLQYISKASTIIKSKQMTDVEYHYVTRNGLQQIRKETSRESEKYF